MRRSSERRHCLPCWLVVTQFGSGAAYDPFLQTRMLPLQVDQVMAGVDIATMWGDHFEGTMNCVVDAKSEWTLLSDLCSMVLEGFHSVDQSEL